MPSGASAIEISVAAALPKKVVDIAVGIRRTGVWVTTHVPVELGDPERTVALG